MKDFLKIGYIVADEDEYVPLRAMVDKLNAKRADFYSREGHSFCFEDNGKKIEVHAILCGVGMVNATAAATYLAGEGADIILCSGLSGGISGIKRGEITIGTEYIEHDFDLTPLGYKMCEKPLQKYVYKADETLLDVMCDIYPDLKRGVIVSGDCFIGDNNKKNYLKETFGAMSCDMESAAVAYVCDLAKIPFAAIRRISDDAGNDAGDSYSQMNNLRQDVLIDLLIVAVKKFFGYNILWK
ncbi:MAG: 5'-methylthioadenosine/S-adenosylhomocysteine nucleosidase [Clostridia bacterium]|nr:5'-methylthioadenosine/S-adenosylhomocysteine nucleosidase [Clostridia bacterium]